MPYTHLSASERTCIFYQSQIGHSARQIARYLGRSHTTISRELSRNARPHNSYCDHYAQVRANERKAIPRHRLKHNNASLYAMFNNYLTIGWSPEIISKRLKRLYPRDSNYHVSTETLYQWTYQDAAQGGELYTYLVCHHKKRRKQRRYGSFRGHIPNRTDISERPDSVGERRRYGDWEGDTMVGHQHKGRLVTHVERKSRYLLAAKISKGTSIEFNRATLELFRNIPKQYRKTLTLDNGSENVGHGELEKEIGIKVYFATPYASWQRGTNENTNGLLRRHFPKGTDFLEIPNIDLDRAVELLNHRPRKCLDYQTPYEVFNRITGGALGT